MAGESIKGTRVIALVGPAGAGKTSLAEAMLFAAGATDRLGSTANGSSIGDSSPEAASAAARPSSTSTISNISATSSPFSTCPDRSASRPTARGRSPSPTSRSSSSIPIPARAPLAAPALRALDELGIPHLIFVNRIDQAHGRIRDLLSALQPMSVSPLIARQIPIWDGEKISGFVDLALERAFKYRAGQESERIEIPAELQEREIEARTHMLEQLADHDDELLEQLLMDQTPTPRKDAPGPGPRNRRESRRLRAVRVGQQLLGRPATAEGDASRGAGAQKQRPTVSGSAVPSLYVFKVIHGSIGRLALSRALGGRIAEGSDLKTGDGDHARVGSLFKVQGEKTQKVSEAHDGDIVAVAKIDTVKAGAMAGVGKLPPPSRSSIRRATARSPSSPPTARMTSSCRAHCNGCSRRTRRSSSSMTKPITRSDCEASTRSI